MAFVIVKSFFIDIPMAAVNRHKEIILFYTEVDTKQIFILTEVVWRKKFGSVRTVGEE